MTQILMTTADPDILIRAKVVLDEAMRLQTTAASGSLVF